MIGKTVSHYKILEKLGEGGMGVVYKAEDTSLKRNVALKFLPRSFSADAEAKERFIHEARATSSLEHSNICTLHEIDEAEDGQIFICMAYYEGETLKKKIDQGPLTVDDALNFAAQITEGLARAHELNIAHRDIKPANIMITARGEVKIVDFGLAKFVGQTTITKAGSTVGTVAYMSPEQARGEKVDHRTDIWSFGIVLYEMVAGQRPFQSAYDQALVYLILNESYEKLSTLRKDVPAELEKIIDRCLQKDPTGRYQNVTDIQKDLEAIKDPDVAEKPKISGRLNKITIPVSLAVLLLLLISLPAVRSRMADWFTVLPGEKHLVVLPFTNIGSDPANQAFCDGLAESLTSELTRLAQFHRSVWVVPMSEVREEKITSASQAQKLFGATLAVTGSVQRGGDDIRLTLNLVDTKTLRQLESSVIDDRVASLATLQNGVLIKLAEMLQVELQPQSLKKIITGNTNVSQAYDLYLQGRGYLQRYEKTENIDKAIILFQKAIGQDSAYALPYAGLGEAFWRKYENSKAITWVEPAITNCKRSVNLNDQLEPVHVTLGLIYRGTGRYDEAIQEYQQALAIDPMSAGAHGGLARTYGAQGKLQEAEKAYKKAIELKPDYWGFYNDLGKFYYVHGRYEEAASQFLLVTTLTPDNTRGLTNVGGMYALLERWDDARQMFERSLKVEPTYEAYSNLAYIYYYTGDYSGAAQMYEHTLETNDKDYAGWGNLGSAYLASGNKDKAAEAYTRAIKLGEEQLKVNPRDPEVLSALAEYYSDIGEGKQARNFIDKALSADPKNVQVMFRAGFVHEQLKEREKALSWLKKALENGYSFSEIEHEPGFRELRMDDRFQPLQKKYKDKKK